MQNTKYKEFNAGRAGSGSVDLATGALTFIHEDTASDANTLPIQISHVYTSNRASDTSDNDVKYGKGFRLNLQQTLRKNEPDGTKYTYTDAGGKEHRFEDRYYYIGDGEKRTYVPALGNISIDADGKLTYASGSCVYDVFPQQITESGLTLQSELKAFKGSKYLETRQDEQKQLEEAVTAYRNGLKEYIKLDKNYGETVETLNNSFTDNEITDVKFEKFCKKNDYQILLTETEAIQYNSLLLQMTQKNDTVAGKRVTGSKYNDDEDYTVEMLKGSVLLNKFVKGSYGTELVNLQRLINDLKADFYLLLRKSDYGVDTLNYQYEDSMRMFLSKYEHQTDDCKLNVNSVGAANDGKTVSLVSHAGKLKYSKNGRDEKFYCDLRAEYDTITTDIAHFLRQEINYPIGVNEAFIDDKNMDFAKQQERQKELEQRIKKMETSFANRVAKLQTNIEHFEKEVNDYIQAENSKLVDRQITLMLEKAAQNEKEIQTYYKEYRLQNTKLKYLTDNLPVNFLIDKDNMTLGFNKAGNLVTLFDSYDNQIVIVYENGVIVKVADADNREIVFEYESKSDKKGKLVSVTDYKGHKTSFIYGPKSGALSDAEVYLRKIEYPNGEVSEFLYTPKGLLNEMLSPSKIGASILYDTENKGAGISELTAAAKIDKTGVANGEKIAEEAVVISYNEKRTFVRDTKTGIAELNLFDANGNLLSVQTIKNDKLVSYTSYGESSVFETAKRCNFVSTVDGIEVNGIPEIDLLGTGDENPVTLDGKIGAQKAWTADITKLDPDYQNYFLCGSATAASSEKTPIRKKTEYCKNYCEHDKDSSYRRFEYKVLVDYSNKEPSTSYFPYTPFETGDTIDTLCLNHYFKGLPDNNVSDFFGERLNYAPPLKYCYPIFGVGEFNRNFTVFQVFYTTNFSWFTGKYDECALWAGDDLLWCNELYAKKNNDTPGWQQSEIDLSSWGPITVHRSSFMHNWGKFLSKDRVFHNGSSSNPNFAKDNEDFDIDEFIAGFDYRINKSQHVAIPITLRTENGKPKMPKKITVLAQYKQSQGEAVFERPTLTKGKVAYSWLDELSNTVFESKPDPEKIAVNDRTDECSTVTTSVSTDYNDNNLPTEKRTVYHYNTKNGVSEQTAAEKWFYNPQGKVIEHWSYVEGEELTNGIDITETVYDERGNAVKSFAYNSLDASTKFYSEQELEENGRVLADVDETGAYKTHYEYDYVTGKVITATSPNGGKLSYAHDTDTDEITAITQSTEDGEGNATNRVYTAGCLTELTSGGNKINYRYDRKGRKSAVYLNGLSPYAVCEYKDRTEADPTDTVTATLAPTDGVSSYTVKTERDKDGNLIRVSEGRDPLSLTDSVVNLYFGNEDKDREGLLKTGEDKLTGTKTEYEYNSLGQSLSATARDSVTNALISSETAEYNEYGLIAKRRIVSGSYTQEYGYKYKDNHAKELESIAMPFGICGTRITDTNGRLKERVLTANGIPLAHEYFYFRKSGDHGTNQISSVRYGELINGEYVIKDGVSYTYDECGNISVIKENGKLSSRYGYDKLNRLIREDNAKLGFTALITYDNNGNILSKRKTAFSMCETEKLADFANEKEYAYSAAHPDRLMSYGDERIYGYDAIGNPTSYRGKTLVWQKGRQLASVTDNVEKLSFTYDASGKRIGKLAEGEHTKYFYAGDMLIREERCDENNIQYFGDDLVAGDNSVEGDGIVVDSVNKSVLEYFYGQEGVAGLVYDGVKYYFRRNVQGDVTRIYAIDGTLAACYTYDAWGNHKVLDANGNVNKDPNFIGNLNPYRYRGYYFDTETGLYYLNSRYYDSEIGRFINADSIEYLDPETINGLNLYAYCLNNPVMLVDPTGCAPKWWQWMLFGIGVALVVAAAVVLTVATLGVGTAAFGATLAGSIALNASIGTLIGAGVGTAIGIAGGAIYADVTGADMGESILSGFLMGFGIGAIAGAVIGGSIGGAQFGTFGSKASLNTHLTKHGTKMGYSSAKEYAKGAKYVIKNGSKISYSYKGKITTGYIRFLGQGGGANYAFVGMNGGRVATFGVRGVSDLIKLGVPWLII